MTGNEAITRDENLRTYLTGDSAAFADVCREFVAVYYPHGTIRELSVGDDGWADIWGLCEHFGYRLLHLVTLPH